MILYIHLSNTDWFAICSTGNTHVMPELSSAVCDACPLLSRSKQLHGHCATVALSSSLLTSLAYSILKQLGNHCHFKKAKPLFIAFSISKINIQPSLCDILPGASVFLFGNHAWFLDSAHCGFLPAMPKHNKVLHQLFLSVTHSFNTQF